MSSEREIVVAGTGPAGMIAALGLARAGLPSRLPALPPRRDDRRTTALMRPALRISRQRSACLPRIADQAAPLKVDAHRRRDVAADPQPGRDLPRQRDRRGFFGLNMPNAALNAALRRGCRRSRQSTGGDRLVDDWDDRRRATSPRGSPTAARSTRALAVAADGRDSPARRGGRHRDVDASLSAVGARAQFRAQPRPRLHLDRIPHRDRPVHAGAAAGQPLEPGLGGEAGDGRGAGRARRCRAVAPRRGADAVDARPRDGRAGPADLSAVGDAAARASRKNRIALVGEAAHVFPPIGAQGLNLGIRDVEDIVANRFGEYRDDPGSAGSALPPTIAGAGRTSWRAPAPSTCSTSRCCPTCCRRRSRAAPGSACSARLRRCGRSSCARACSPAAALPGSFSSPTGTGQAVASRS